MRLSQLDPPQQAQDLLFRSAPNWTAVIFFAVMAVMHSSIAIPAFYLGRWEGFVSAIFAVAFSGLAVVAWRWRSDISVRPATRQLVITQGWGPLKFDRAIPFSNVHAVRLTMLKAPDDPVSRIEVVCDSEDIECPATDIPRQEALLLAMTLGVRLIKVSGENMDVPHMPDASRPRF